MTRVLEHLFGKSCKKINIHDINLKNGCLGCCTCGYDNTCVQKDGFVKFYNENLKTADTIIIAGSIKDHYLSAQWKKFFDRSFFNGHAPVLKGKRAGFVISGNLRQHQNLREILDVFYENWHMKSIPQRKLKKRWRNALFGLFLAIKPVRQKIHQKFIPGMVAPYKKVLKEME